VIGVIDEVEAAVVRRIFADYAAGKSPRAIARELNGEGVRGPGGRPWSDTTIRGHHIRRTGVLHNEMYIGQLVWNKQRYVKDPTTGKRLARVNPESAWVIGHSLATDHRPGALGRGAGSPFRHPPEPGCPERDQEEILGTPPAEASPHRPREMRRLRRRPCSRREGLSRLRRRSPQGTCSSRKSLKRAELEGVILDALKGRLMAPDLVAEFIREFHAEVNRQRHEVELARRPRSAANSTT
jgi:hypothetical protein